jgi:hypothetical protein
MIPPNAALGQRAFADCEKECSKRGCSVLVLRERLGCTTRRKEVLKSEMDARIATLTERKEQLQSDLARLAPDIRESKESMRQHHEDLLSVMKGEFVDQCSVLSKRKENQYRFRSGSWDVTQMAVFDQIGALLDLMRFSYEGLPFHDKEPYVYIAKSMFSSIQTCENSNIQLRTLHCEIDNRSSNLSDLLAQIDRKTTRIKTRTVKIQEKFESVSRFLNDAERQMQSTIEEVFRSLLAEHGQKTRAAHRRSQDHLNQARISKVELGQKRHDSEAIVRPDLLVPDVFLAEAKVRVSRIVLANLRDENIALRRVVAQLHEVCGV